MVILKMIYLKKTSIKLWWFWRWSISKKNIHKTMVILKMIYLKKTSYGDFEDDLSQKTHP